MKSNREEVRDFLRKRLDKLEMKEFGKLMTKLNKRYCKCEIPTIYEGSLVDICYDCNKLIDWNMPGKIGGLIDRVYLSGVHSVELKRKSQAPLLRLKRWFYFRVWCRIKGDRIPF